jgi:hypothetical protein
METSCYIRIFKIKFKKFKIPVQLVYRFNWLAYSAEDDGVF